MQRAHLLCVAGVHVVDERDAVLEHQAARLGPRHLRAHKLAHALHLARELVLLLAPRVGPRTAAAAAAASAALVLPRLLLARSLQHLLVAQPQTRVGDIPACGEARGREWGEGFPSGSCAVAPGTSAHWASRCRPQQATPKVHARELQMLAKITAAKTRRSNKVDGKVLHSTAIRI